METPFFIKGLKIINLFKKLGFLGLVALAFWGCQTSSPKQKSEETASVASSPAESTSEKQLENFSTQSQDICSYENGRLFSDDFGNSICARGYRSAERNNHDVLLIFNFTTEPLNGESRRLTTCTTLSANRIEKSYLCEIGKRYFFVAYYQRGHESGNRIWLEEVPAQQVSKRLKLNQEEYRENLKKIHGKFELQPNNFSKNKEFLQLIN